MRLGFFLSAMAFSIFAQAACPDWIVQNSGLSIRNTCYVTQHEAGMKLGRAIIFGDAREPNDKQLSGISILYLEWSSYKKNLRVLHKQSGLGSEILKIEFQNKIFDFLKLENINHTNYFIGRTLSDRVSLLFVIQLKGDTIEILKAHESNGLIRNAIVGSPKGIAKIFTSKENPLYIRIPYQDTVRTYFLTGNFFVAR